MADRPTLLTQGFYILCYAAMAEIMSIVIAIDNTSERDNVKKSFNIYDLFGKPYVRGIERPLPIQREALIFIASVAIGGAVGALFLRFLRKALSPLLASLTAFLLAFIYVAMFLVRDNVLWLFINYKMLNGFVLAILSFSVPELLHAATPHVSGRTISMETGTLLLINGLLYFLGVFHFYHSRAIFRNFLVVSTTATIVATLVFYLINELMSESENKEPSKYHLYVIVLLKSTFAFPWDYELLTVISTGVWLICVGYMSRLVGWKQISIFYLKMLLMSVIGQVLGLLLLRVID
jgi:hypothetical protein